MLNKKQFLSFLMGVFAFGSILFAQVSSGTVVQQSTAVVKHADAVVILGKALRPDGSMMHELVERLYWGMQPYLRGEVDKIIVSGGSARGGAAVSEAQVMRGFLVSNGIPIEDILLEQNSYSTVENAKNVSVMVKDLGMTKIIICSSPYHMDRLWDNPISLFRENLKTDVIVEAVPNFPVISDVELPLGYQSNARIDIYFIVKKRLSRHSKKLLKSELTQKRNVLVLQADQSVKDKMDYAQLKQTLLDLEKIYGFKRDDVYFNIVSKEIIVLNYYSLNSLLDAELLPIID